MALAFDSMSQAGLPINEYPHPTIAAFTIHIDIPEEDVAENYLRTIDFESGELKVRWNDKRGEWVRQIFASRPDNVVAQLSPLPKASWSTRRSRSPNPSPVRALRAVQSPSSRMQTSIGFSSPAT